MKVVGSCCTDVKMMIFGQVEASQLKHRTQSLQLCLSELASWTMEICLLVLAISHGSSSSILFFVHLLWPGQVAFIELDSNDSKSRSTVFAAFLCRFG